MTVRVSRALSVVIPAFDAAPWLPSTLVALAEAIRRGGVDAEVIVVNDGSHDETVDVVEALASGYPVPLRVLSQENRGRFLARWAGAVAARHERLLMLDARVLVDPDALSYVGEHPEFEAWNGHVRTDESTPLVGRFWEVPTHVFWRRYLRRPRPTSITSESFDALPKGTGFLLVPRDVYRTTAEATWPAADAYLVSDDTRLLRELVRSTPLRLDPAFGATYRPRTTLRGFLMHAFDRGTLFVDSYAGTSTLRDVVLLALALIPPAAFLIVVALALAGLWVGMIVVVAVAMAALLALPLAAAGNGAPLRAILAYFLYVLPFGVVFWAGLVRGLVIHRRAFGRRHQPVGVRE